MVFKNETVERKFTKWFIKLLEQFMWYWVQPYYLTSILQHLTIWQPPPYDTFLHNQISYFKIISYDMTNTKWYDKKPSYSHKIEVINV
jgi:hypothetical protein